MILQGDEIRKRKHFHSKKIEQFCSVDPIPEAPRYYSFKIPGWWDMRSEKRTQLNDTDVSFMLYGNTWLVGYAKRSMHRI